MCGRCITAVFTVRGVVTGGLVTRVSCIESGGQGRPKAEDWVDPQGFTPLVAFRTFAKDQKFWTICFPLPTLRNDSG